MTEAETSMIERVARAIWQATTAIVTEAGERPDNWDDCGPEHDKAREEWRRLARAAIEAMREPPAAYMTRYPAYLITNGDGWYPPNRVRGAIWRDMIGVALSPVPLPDEERK